MSEVLVFDTGPLSTFAEAGWLKILQAIAGDRGVLMPEVVQAEINSSIVTYPFLHQVLQADWIKVDRTESDELFKAFAWYHTRLTSGGKNLGECGVLALAEVHGATAIIDDRVARTAGKERGVRLSGTLALLCEGIRQGMLTVPLVSKIADDLLATKYRLPFGPGDFEAWARVNGLVE